MFANTLLATVHILCTQLTLFLLQNKKDMFKYAGILFRSIRNETKEPVYLLGREATVPGWSESGRWSDFGGSPKDSFELFLDTMAREATEELMGILGCTLTVKEQLKQCSTVHILKGGQVFMAVLEVPYDALVTVHYNNVYKHLTKCMTDHPTWKGFRHISSCPEGYCEKVELGWFTAKDILENKDQMRPAFYESFCTIHGLNK